MSFLNRKIWPIGALIAMLLTGVAVTTTVVLTLLNIQREQRAFNQNLQQQARLILNTFINVEADTFYNLNVSEIHNALESITGTEFLVSARAYDANGVVIVDTTGSVQVPSLTTDPFGIRILNSPDELFEDSSNFLSAGKTVRVGNQNIGAVSIVLSKEQLKVNVRTIQLWSLLTGLVISILGIALSTRLGQAITRPVTLLGQAAEDIARGQFTQDIKTTNIKELNDLAELFVVMRNNLQEVLKVLSDETNELARHGAELDAANQVNQRRAKQFEAITRVGNTISSIRSLKELLSGITQIISEQFGYYHVGIFLIDSDKQFAVLSAANSEGGRKMLARGHQLKIGEQGIVGYATGSAKARIALDVGADAVYFDNPELPLTRSEMALPLKNEDQIIGALDVQSTESNAFSNDDIEVLSALADQVSLAIQNARLFEQTTKLLAQSEAAQRQYLQTTWGRLTAEQKLFGYRYSITGVTPLDEHEDNRDGAHKQEISWPINLRGEHIGTLAVHMPTNEQISPDQLDLLKAVAERLGLAMDNARLFEETSSRASRERLVSEITSRIRESNDPQEMIKVAVDELRQALRATRVEIISQKAAPPPDK